MPIPCHQYYVPTCALSRMVLQLLSFVSSTGRKRIFEMYFAYVIHLIIVLFHDMLGTVDILHILNYDITRGQITFIVKVKIENCKCTGLMLSTLANPFYNYYCKCDVRESVDSFCRNGTNTTIVCVHI